MIEYKAHIVVSKKIKHLLNNISSQNVFGTQKGFTFFKPWKMKGIIVLLGVIMFVPVVWNSNSFAEEREKVMLNGKCSLDIQSIENRVDMMKLQIVRNIVARDDYSISKDFASPNIMGRNFWNCLRPIRKKDLEKARNIQAENMVKDAVTDYVFPATTVWSSVKQISQKKDMPFIVSVPPDISMFKDYEISEKMEKEYAEFKRNNPNFIGFRITEWDNCFLRQSKEYRLSLEKNGYDKELVNSIEKSFTTPKTKEQLVLHTKVFYETMEKWLLYDRDRMTFMNAGWRFDHYPLGWGARGGTCIETTATGSYWYQLSLFFARGASRQYRVPWQWYIALFYNGYEKDGKLSKGVPDFVRENNSPASYGHSPILRGINNGLPISLDKRTRYLAFLSGASIIESESWPYAYCMDKGNAYWELSPLGEVMKEWYLYIQKNPDRGISYSPVALLLPFSHAYKLENFPVENEYEKRSDRMIDAVMKTIVPPTENLKKGLDGCLSNSRFGDIYDVLIPDQPGATFDPAVLNNYKVVFLIGNINITEPLAKIFQDYVENGGTLIINNKQVNKYFNDQFLGVSLTGDTYKLEEKINSLIAKKQDILISDGYEYEKLDIGTAYPIFMSGSDVIASINKYGKGNVILVSVSYLLPAEKNISSSRNFPLVEFLLANIVSEVLPVEVKGDIEYGLNKLTDGWLIYLINNKGIYKHPCSPQEINMNETSFVTVKLKDVINPIMIKDIRNDKTIIFREADHTFDISVEPGDIAIIKIKQNENNKSGDCLGVLIPQNDRI